MDIRLSGNRQRFDSYELVNYLFCPVRSKNCIVTAVI